MASTSAQFSCGHASSPNWRDAAAQCLQQAGMIREALGEFPLVGFFCNGEISHNRLYGYTGVLTLFL